MKEVITATAWMRRTGRHERRVLPGARPRQLHDYAQVRRISPFMYVVSTGVASQKGTSLHVKKTLKLKPLNPNP